MSDGPKPKLFLACDHAGYELKNHLKNFVANSSFVTSDLGTDGPDSVDYPDFAHPLANSVVDENGIGILICGSGNGVCMSANKHQGVRAALCWNTEIARMARLHNDANVLCLPARYITRESAEEIIQVFLTTEFEGGRHERRVNKINND